MSVSLPLVQAAARQAKFESSAVGRATMKSVKAAAKEDHSRGRSGPDTIQDWNS